MAIPTKNLLSPFCSTSNGNILPFFAFRRKTKNPDSVWKSGFYCLLLFLKVVPPGIEPGTQGFSVLCSTNWAMAPFLFCVAKVWKLFQSTKQSWNIFEKISNYTVLIKKVEIFFGNTKIISTFAPQSRRNESNRNVAQLVAHYVRDVGVGRSSRLIPTRKRLSWFS